MARVAHADGVVAGGASRGACVCAGLVAFPVDAAYNAVKFGHTDERVYSKLTSENPIDLVRYQLANCYMGRAGLINSGGASAGATDVAESVRTAVINKRAGGMGLILGRKAFKKSLKEGVALINAVQDVYLAKDVTIA